VNEHAVDAHGKNLHPQLLVVFVFFGNRRNLCRSDKGEVAGVETEKVREAAVTAMRANRLGGRYAQPTPATQIVEIIRHIPQALRQVLEG